jgi:uncharacterized membrane protein HdeD (DUF308 family)
MKEGPENLIENTAGLSIGLALLMIVLGVLAIVMPMLTGLAVSVMFGWIVLIGGFVYVGYAFTAKGVGAFLWRMLISAVYVVGGSYLILNTAVTLEVLTFVVACVFVAEGLFQIFAFIALRAMPASGWLLLDGIVSIVLGLLVAYHWPGSSAWVIGTLVGANLLVSGFTRLFFSAAVKQAVSSPA